MCSCVCACVHACVCVGVRVCVCVCIFCCRARIGDVIDESVCCMCMCVFFCLAVFISLSCLFLCLCVCVCVCAGLHVDVYLSVCLAIYLLVHPSVNRPIHLSVSHWLTRSLARSLTQSLTISANISLLPIVILQEFKMPPYLLHLTKIFYTRPEQDPLFWQRIRGFFRSLSTSQESEEASTSVYSVEKARPNDGLAATSSVHANIAQSEAKDYFSLGAGDDVVDRPPEKLRFPFQKKTKHSLKKSRKTIFDKIKLMKNPI